MKRFSWIAVLATALTLLFCTFPTTAALAPQIVVGTAQGSAGDTVQIPVSVKNNPGFCAFRLHINYDTERLTLESVKLAPDLGGNFNYAKMAVWLGGSDVSEDCDILTLEFTIKSTAPAGSADISVYGASEDISNLAEESVSFAFISGKIDVQTADSGNDDVSKSNDSGSDNKSNNGGSVSKSSDSGSSGGGGAKSPTVSNDDALQQNVKDGTIELDHRTKNAVTIRTSELSKWKEESVDSLSIELNQATVRFNSAALAALAEQAGSNDLNMSVTVSKTTDGLNDVQRKAVNGLSPTLVLDATLTAKTAIHDFGGGSATVLIPYTPEEDRGVAVWYVADDGTLERVSSSYADGVLTFTVSHFSQYVVGYDQNTAETCLRDMTCPLKTFPDLDPSFWYHDGVHFALENGVMVGDSKGFFRPNTAATRSAVTVVLWNLAGKPMSDAALPFDDVDQNGWYADALRWGVANGVVAGSRGHFYPNEPVTREQLAVMLYNYAKFQGADVSARADLSAYDDMGDGGKWALDATQWAVGFGLLNGRSHTAFAPKGTAVRAELAVLIARYCNAVKN